MSSDTPQGSPAALEEAIDARRNHLAATIDELTARVKPQAIARRGAAGIAQKAQAAVRTPEGGLRTERIGAVAGAFAVLLAVTVWLRRKR